MQGKDVLTILDVQGAEVVRKLLPDTITVFMEPPTTYALEERLINRGTETDEQVVRRLETAHVEMARVWEYDYRVVNDNSPADAAFDIAVIIDVEKMRVHGRGIDWATVHGIEGESI